MKENKDDLITAETLKVGQDKLIKDVGKLTGQVEKLQQGQNKLTKDVGKLTGHVEKLQQGQDELQQGQDELRHGQDELREGQQKLEEGQARLEARQEHQEMHIKRLDEHVGFIVQTMGEHHDEIKRYFEILIEQHRAEMRSQGEGYRANRDRLDDHEERTQDLEAS